MGEVGGCIICGEMKEKRIKDMCVKCYQKRYREKNKERIRELKKKWKNKNIFQFWNSWKIYKE